MGIISVMFSKPRCVFCKKPIRSHTNNLICDTCTSALPFTDSNSMIPGEYYSICCAPLYNEGIVNDSLKRFKYKNATGYSETYGLILSKYISENLKGSYDLISWVPLSEKRLNERGYDQSMLLALATALELSDVAVSTLEKTIDVASQSAVDSVEKRRENVSGAYRVSDSELVSGKRILLIDDTVSSGSTLSECAKMLKEAGASEVLCVALAMSR